LGNGAADVADVAEQAPPVFHHGRERPCERAELVVALHDDVGGQVAGRQALGGSAGGGNGPQHGARDPAGERGQRGKADQRGEQRNPVGLAVGILAFLQRLVGFVAEIGHYLGQQRAYFLMMAVGALHGRHAGIGVHRGQVERLRHAGAVLVHQRQGLGGVGRARQRAQLLERLADRARVAVGLLAVLFEFGFGQAARDGDPRIRGRMHLPERDTLLAGLLQRREGYILQALHAAFVRLHRHIREATENQQPQHGGGRDYQQFVCDLHDPSRRAGWRPQPHGEGITGRRRRRPRCR